MMKVLYRSIFVTVLLFSFSSFVLAQNGGKAEGKPIKFKRGATSTTINNKAKNGLEYEYTFTAKAGQVVTIGITATPLHSVGYKLMFDGERVSTCEMKNPGEECQITLPSDGEYLLTVLRIPNNKGTSKYSLKLSIK